MINRKSCFKISVLWLLIIFFYCLFIGLTAHSSPMLEASSYIQWKTDGKHLFSLSSNELTQWNDEFEILGTYLLPPMKQIKTFSANAERFFWIDANNDPYLYFLESREIVPFKIKDSSDSFWQNPIDMTISHDMIYVLDSVLPSIECFNQDGIHQKSILLPESIVPSSIFYRYQKIYISDLRSLSIIVLDEHGFKKHRFGQKGTSRGCFHALGSFWVDATENIYVQDPELERLTCFSSLTNIPWHIKNNTDFFAISSQQIAFILIPSGEITLLPMPCSGVKSIPENMDFGLLSVNKFYRRDLIIYTQGSALLDGAISVDSPYVSIKENKKTLNYSYFTVSINLPDEYSDQSFYGKIQYTTQHQGSINVVITANGSNEDHPSLYLASFIGRQKKSFYLPLMGIDPKTAYKISVEGLQGAKIQAKLLPFTVISLPFQMLKLTSEHYLTPGLHEGRIILEFSGDRDKAQEKTILHIPFFALIRAEESYIPRETLMEGFDAVWCLKSSLSHQATELLKEALFPYPLVYIRYYVQTSGKIPELDIPGVDNRLRFYQNDHGLFTYYFNGLNAQKGLPPGRDTRTDEGKLRVLYERFLERYLIDHNAYASFGFITSIQWENEGQGSLELEIFHDGSVVSDSLSLNVVLVRKYLHAQTIMGNSDHIDVFQKYLTPVEDRFYGIPIQKNNLNSVFQVPIALPLPDKHLYDLIIFIQDQKRKEVWQSLRIEL